MKSIMQLACITTGLLLLAGCLSVKNEYEPTVSVPKIKTPSFPKPATPSVSLKATSLPDMLGGIVSSDSWIVYNEKQEEEFKGHVRYDNGIYILRSDYALSQRKKNLFTLKGNIYFRHNEPDGAWYEVYADKAVYNYQTGKGYALASKKEPLKLVYHSAQNEQITAYAKRADIDTQQQVYKLTTDAVLIHQDALGNISTLKADSMLAKQQEQYVFMQGHAEAYDAQYHLKAQTLEYDGLTHHAYVYGERPLLQGTTQEGTFAIIADKATAQTDSQDIHLEGQVQGWIVSDRINKSKLNQTF